jgi:hypothetical protein
MVSSEAFFQLNQARAKHNALQATAREREKYPMGRETTRSAGLKMKPATSNATVVVYVTPVDFWDRSNIPTSSVVLLLSVWWTDKLA